MNIKDIQELENSMANILIWTTFIIPIPFFLAFVTHLFDFFLGVIIPLVVAFLLALVTIFINVPNRFSSNYKEYIRLTSQSFSKVITK